MRRLRAHRARLVLPIAALAAGAASGCAPAPAPPAETWALERVTPVPGTVERVEQSVTVRHCGSKEMPTVSCETGRGLQASAGTALSQGLGAGLGAYGVQVNVSVERAATLEVAHGVQRSLGFLYPLDPPQPGFIRSYAVVYEYRVLRGQAALRSSLGTRRAVPYSFVHGCQIHADPAGEDVPCDPNAAEPSPSPGAGPGPDPQAETEEADTEDSPPGEQDAVVSGLATPGRVKGRAALGLSLTALRVGGSEVPVATAELRREKSGRGSDLARVGIGGLLGAGVGALVGGKRGAVAGGGLGAAGAQGANMIDRGDHLVIEPGTELTFRLSKPVLVPVRRLR